MPRFFVPALFLVCCGGLFAQQVTPNTPKDDKSSETSGSNYRSVDALNKKGFKQCSSAMARITQFLYDADDFAYLNLWHETNPNKHTATTLISKDYPDGASLSNVASTPTADSTCDTTFTQIMLLRQTCAKLRETSFKDWKYYADLGQIPMYEDPTSGNVNVMLVPAQGGCLLVKTGTLFFPNDTTSADLMRSNEVSAVRTIRMYNTSFVVYASSYPKIGFPKKLEDLGASGASQPNVEHAALLDSDLTSQPFEKSGYRFKYIRVKTGDQYKIFARPVKVGESGLRSFYSDQSGIIRYTEEDREPTAKDPALQ